MERLSLIFILSALAFIFSFQVAASGPTGVSPHLAATLGAAVIGGAFWWLMPPSAKVHRQPLRGGIAIGAAIAAVPAAVLFFVVSPGAVLPGHDPIIVPTLAQILLSHATTMEVYRPGDPGFTYPPGYPILFSLVSLVASPLASLIIFKVWTVVLLVLIPVGWAWMASRIFRIRLPYPVLLLLAFVAVFGLERTVSYSLQHGKNAQMLAGALFPGLVALLLMSSRRIAGLPFAVVALTAGILVHYSTLYLAATFFFAWYIVHFPRERAEWAAALRLAVSGALSLALFALILPEAFNDPRAGGFGVPALGDGLMRMAGVFLNRYDELLFIFNWGAENNLKSPYRALILTGCLVISVLIGYGLRRERDDAGPSPGWPVSSGSWCCSASLSRPARCRRGSRGFRPLVPDIPPDRPDPGNPGGDRSLLEPARAEAGSWRASAWLGIFASAACWRQPILSVRARVAEAHEVGNAELVSRQG